MRYTIYLTLASLVLLLAACGGSPNGQHGHCSTDPVDPLEWHPGNPGTSRSPAPQSDPVQPTGQPLGQDVVIALQKTGGIAGMNETLTVHADGTIKVNGRGGQGAPDRHNRACPASAAPFQRRFRQLGGSYGRPAPI